MKTIKSSILFAIAAFSFVFLNLSTSGVENYGNSFVVVDGAISDTSIASVRKMVVQDGVLVYPKYTLVLSASEQVQEQVVTVKGLEPEDLEPDAMSSITSSYNIEYKKNMAMKSLG